MAGTRRFQVTLGPFPSQAKRLSFRFHCEDPTCHHDFACCLGLKQSVAGGPMMRRRSTPRQNDRETTS